MTIMVVVEIIMIMVIIIFLSGVIIKFRYAHTHTMPHFGSPMIIVSTIVSIRKYRSREKGN